MKGIVNKINCKKHYRVKENAQSGKGLQSKDPSSVSRINAEKKPCVMACAFNLRTGEPDIGDSLHLAGQAA